eukprot:9423711-Pyramimonas_sp.AAC.1
MRNSMCSGLHSTSGAAPIGRDLTPTKGTFTSGGNVQIFRVVCHPNLCMGGAVESCVAAASRRIYAV